MIGVFPLQTATVQSVWIDWLTDISKGCSCVSFCLGFAAVWFGNLAGCGGDVPEEKLSREIPFR